jgi:inosose dehydratase
MTHAVSIGTNPIAWSNDDLPTLGKEISLQTCLAQAHAIGFQGIELGHKFPRDAGTLQSILSEYPLTLISGWYSSQLLNRSAEEEIAAMQPHCQLLKAMACPVMIWCETTGCIHHQPHHPLSQRPRLAKDQWAGFGERLSRVAEYLLSQNIQLVYHHHMGSVVETVNDIDRLLECTTEAVSLLFDTGHILFAGGDPVIAARKYGHRIRHVHCKDVRADILAWSKAENASFLDAVVAGVYTVPGDGCIDFPAVLAEIKAAGYANGTHHTPAWFVIEAEQDPAKADPFKYGMKGFRYLSQLITMLGWKITSPLVPTTLNRAEFSSGSNQHGGE